MTTVNVLKFQTLFLFLFPNETLVISAVTHKMIVKKANREDLDPTASGSALFVLPLVAGNYCSKF